MTWYYNLDKEEVYHTDQELTPEQCVKKSLLSYRKTTSSVQDEVGIVIGETEVVETFYKAPKRVLTLAEEIAFKIESSGKSCYQYVTDKYPEYKQLSALHGGIYTDEENQTIKDFCAARVIGFRLWKEHIQTLTTIEEVEACNWRTTVTDDDTLEVISETFWGE